MIQNLNPLSFNMFGQIITHGFFHACNMLHASSLSVREIEIKSCKVETLFCSKNSPLVFDIVDGIALLCVSQDIQQNQTQVFLLDKTILLHPGAYYRVIPLYGSCTIRYAHQANIFIQEVPVQNAPEGLGYMPSIEIKAVYTLFYQEKEQGFIFKGEKHDFWELTYVDKGVMYTIVDGKGYKLCQGDLLFYDSMQHHIQWADPGSSVCYITISFDMNMPEQNPLVSRKFSIGSDIKKLLEKILYEKDVSPMYADDLIICYMKELIIQLIRQEGLERTILHQETAVKHQIENSLVSKAVEFIQKNIHRKISIPDIAANIAISPSYLSAIFKKYMNSTLVDYINHLRLEKSKDLIRTSEMNFTQISDALGYSTVHYFSAQFKQKYGISPREYSRSVKR